MACLLCFSIIIFCHLSGLLYVTLQFIGIASIEVCKGNLCNLMEFLVMVLWTVIMLVFVRETQNDVLLCDL